MRTGLGGSIEIVRLCTVAVVVLIASAAAVSIAPKSPLRPLLIANAASFDGVENETFLPLPPVLAGVDSEDRVELLVDGVDDGVESEAEDEDVVEIEADRKLNQEG